MSFDFNSTQELTSLKGVCDCLDTWSKKNPSIEYTLGEETQTVRITVLYKNSFVAATLKNAQAQHTYTSINQVTSGGASALSKHYELIINGQNTKGVSSVLKFFMTYNGEDGKIWSDPIFSFHYN